MTEIETCCVAVNRWKKIDHFQQPGRRCGIGQAGGRAGQETQGQNKKNAGHRYPLRKLDFFLRVGSFLRRRQGAVNRAKSFVLRSPSTTKFQNLRGGARAASAKRPAARNKPVDGSGIDLELVPSRCRVGARPRRISRCHSAARIRFAKWRRRGIERLLPSLQGR